MVEAPRMQILGLGASTPIGRTVWASAAAARAGICGFSEHPFMIDTAGEPMRIARAPWLHVETEDVERHCGLLFPAIDEALGPIINRIPHNLQHLRLGLTLALPLMRPGRPQTLAKDLLSKVQERYADVVSSIFVLEKGHAAGHLALDAAVKHCGSGSIDACVVCGVDSYLAPKTLEWLETCDQLHGSGQFNNAWGFIPGEGAGAVFVGTTGFARQYDLETLGEVVSVGLGLETKPIKTDIVCVGEGLTQAFKLALKAVAPDEQIHNVYCDLNGEAYRADEYGFTALRVKERFRAATEFIAPADCWGDVGAASALLHISLAVISYQKQYCRGPLSMIWASSESGERGATVIRGLESKGD